MQVFAYLLVDLFVRGPANNDFLYRDELAHRIKTLDNLLCGIVSRMPSTQGYLDNIRSLTLWLLILLMAGHKREECNEANNILFQWFKESNNR